LWTTSPSKDIDQNALNHRESQISCLNLKDSGSTKNHQIKSLPADLEGQNHQEKSHKVLNKSRIETPSKPSHEIPPKKAPKITGKEKRDPQANHKGTRG
jgi:hypothetical protein